MKKLYFLLFTLTCVVTATAQLQTGDIAFTGYNADGIDSFSFVTFVDIPANTQIKFTDNGWFAAGGFRATEGIGTWTSPSSTLLAGTEILVSDFAGTASQGTFTSSNMVVSAVGDQLFAYDPANVPSASDNSGFYAGIQMNGDWDTDATSSNTSAQPASLVGFSIAISPEVDNAIYDCSTTTGTVPAFRTAINDISNWTTDNTNALTLPSCSFTISTLSVPQNQIAEFSVFPNPVTNGFVTINTTSNAAIAVNVFDILGKQVLSKTINNNRLEVSSLNTGVYILKLNQNGANTTKKLVIR